MRLATSGANPLDVVRIGHVGADRLSHQFARRIALGIAPVLRPGQVARALLARAECVVEAAKLAIEAGHVDLAGQFVDGVTEFVLQNARDLGRA
jgi:hypothetical protein